jgi:hypothetical protein
MKKHIRKYLIVNFIIIPEIKKATITEPYTNPNSNEEFPLITIYIL